MAFLFEQKRFLVSICIPGSFCHRVRACPSNRNHRKRQVSFRHMNHLLSFSRATMQTIQQQSSFTFYDNHMLHTAAEMETNHYCAIFKSIFSKKKEYNFRFSTSDFYYVTRNVHWFVRLFVEMYMYLNSTGSPFLAKGRIEQKKA